jgi:cobalt/nickel transport system permease protein
MHEAFGEEQFLALAKARRLKPVGRNHIDRGLRRIASVFSDALGREEAARRPGILQQVDPRARLLATLVFLVSVSLASSLPALATHLCLALAALALSRIGLREFLRAGFLATLIFALLIAAPATLNVFVEGRVVLPLLSREQEIRYGPYVLPQVIGVSREGLLTAATFVLRILSSVAAVLWLTLSTRWMDLLRALRFLRLPPVFLQVVGMAVRYLFAFLRQSEEVHLAKKSRSVCRRPIAAEQAWVGSRIATTWERGLHLMVEVSDAMTARGFRGEARFPPGMPFRAPEWGLLVTVAACCAGAQWV